MAKVIRPSLLLLIAAAITIALLLTGVLGGSGPTSAGAASARTPARTHHAQRHATKKHTARHATKKHTARSAQTGDTDNVQAGDQNAPDNPSGENENAS